MPSLKRNINRGVSGFQVMKANANSGAASKGKATSQHQLMAWGQGSRELWLVKNAALEEAGSGGCGSNQKLLFIPSLPTCFLQSCLAVK